MSWQHTVTVKNGNASFECEALYAACHFYPSCDCESWNDDHLKEYGPGHEKEHHAECWLQGWFDNNMIDYVGDDYDDMIDGCIPRDMNRSGTIKIGYEFEWVEWEFEATE